MSNDVYKRLAAKLNEYPQGFPPHPEGVELKILEMIATPQEAEIMLLFPKKAESIDSIAKSIGKPVEELQAITDEMVMKGQLETTKKNGVQMYWMPPFVVGLYEFFWLRTDKSESEQRKFSELFESWLSHADSLMTVVGLQPPYFRVVPVETDAAGEQQVQAYEDIRQVIEESRSFQVQDCMCRKQQRMVGNNCGHSLETCLHMSKEVGAYDKYPELGKIISKKEALKIIDQTEEEGLVHMTYNVVEGQTFVCNCCSCCCGMLRAMKEFKIPTAFAKSNYLATIDPDSCTACGICRDERCPMDAIVEEGGQYLVLDEKCIGCGVCSFTCPVEAISIVPKIGAQCSTPPDDKEDWTRQRAAARGVRHIE
ncbi:4Fe-4S binding protein [Desulforhopalus singaporensis]|uniref:4Fe-4S binding domain-containing protein n=1 Tax=Desulforhopalus singaporensis TaxID=91360 RepID=A0A1H0T150_9BACT|nr:4Fe-4S binding protein [Desulforhopalus singaporensis]SDP47521.1 4Fe-4S binding domain-containing protein [Desulforhopalus singaporensis]